MKRHHQNRLQSTAANKGLTAMLASEYILIDMSLISCIPKLRDQLYEHNRALEYTLGFLSLISNIPKFRDQAAATQTISTSESPERWAQARKFTICYNQ
jgi:hypothetical protein